MNRKRIIAILDGTDPKIGRSVTHTLHALIVLSAIAIALETEPGLPDTVYFALHIFELCILAIFTLEYALRIYASPPGKSYVFSFWGMVDLLAILPATALINPQWQVVRALRLVRLMKLFRTSRALDRLVHSLHEVRGELFVFGVISALMLYISAVGIYIFEHPAQPEVFTSIFTSLWWAVASFSTVGYGDMVPITVGGRLFTTLVLFIGLGIIAVPSAIVTTALLECETDIGRLIHNEPTEPDESNKGDS